jgi:hypothetical protein
VIAVAALLLLARPPAVVPPGPPTFCVEWVRQSREGYERLTLFADRMVVWKTRRGDRDDVRRKRLEPEEAAFYCDYFARPENWDLPGDLRTGLTGDFARTSQVTLARPDGTHKEVRFDELSPLSPAAAALRSSLEGLRAAFESPLAPASRFAPSALSPGLLLKRFDGVVFRIRMVEKEKGIVELEGVTEPYREFRRIEDLRFLFSPPE